VLDLPMSVVVASGTFGSSDFLIILQHEQSPLPTDQPSCCDYSFLMTDGNHDRDRLRTALADGFDVAGVVNRVDVLTYVGTVGLEIVIEVTDLSGQSQADAYQAMCDVLTIRLADAADQVFGFLAFPDEPDPDSLAVGLALMLPGGSNSFTPILPLSRDNAVRLAESEDAIAYLVDDATSLIFIAADHDPPTSSVAETLLGQLDELVDRHCSSDT